MHEVLVEMVDVFARSVVKRSADGYVVKDREVLDVFAQANPTRMRAYRHPELGGQQQHGDNLIDPAQSAAVDLAEVNGPGLQKLLPHHAVVHVLAGRDTDGRYRLADAAVAEDVIGTGRFLDPPRLHLSKAAHRIDRLVDSPDLVRVDHQLPIRSDGRSQYSCPPQVRLRVLSL